jgi:hypothetical protein
VRLRAALTHPLAGWRREVVVEDLGLGGARLVLGDPLVEGPLALGDHVTLWFVAPSLWDPLSITARVAWIRSVPGERGHAGVAFEHRDPQGTYALHELLGTLAFDD